MSVDQNDLLTVKELSQYLRLSLPETYKLLQTNAIVHFRVGKGRGAIRIRESDVTAFLEARQRGPAMVPVERARRAVLKHIQPRR